MVKWVEISSSENHAEKDRFIYLSEVLNQQGCENQVEFVTTSSTDLASVVEECKLKYDQIRVHADFGSILIREMNSLPAEILNIGAIDAIVKEGGHWWVRSFLFKAFHHLVTLRHEYIDTESSALVVGTGSRARVFIAGFVKLGFRNINISSLFDEQGIDLVHILNRNFFGVKFEFVPQSRLVTLPGVHGVMVNTTPIVENNELIDELNYYNFLQQEGVVIDSNLFPVESSLTTEAHNIGASVIQGYEILNFTDIMWAEAVFGVRLDSVKYIKGFYEKYKDQKIESSKTALS